MLFKPRKKPSELVVLELLKARMKLKSEDAARLLILSRGYEGELLFDQYFEVMHSESCLILNDLFFKVNNTFFQIDSFIIFSNQVYVYEIKYFEGDYYYQDEKFFKKPQREIINPLHQLGRTESLLRQLFLQIGVQPQIISNIIFVHPQFTLYEAPLQAPFIFPTQITRHIKELNKLHSNISELHMELAAKLVDMHIEESHFTNYPDYSFGMLRKGLCCSECGELSIIVEKQYCICNLCNKKKTMSAIILHAIEEYQLLFPDKKLQTATLFEWCGKLISKKTIGRVLNKHFNKKGVRQWTYYE